MSDQQLRTISSTMNGAAAVITLQRPEALNALNAQMFDELEREFRHLSSATAVRVILITGSGERAFAAGADIRGLVETDGSSGLAVSRRGQDVFSQIEHCGKPVIACVNGAALGGGCELALACTVRIASDRAKLGLPEAKLGLIPGYGGTQRLPRLIGRSAALRLMLTAQALSAKEALELGLVDEVVSAADLMNRALAIASTIASMAPLAISALLEATRPEHVSSSQEGFGVEAEIFGRLCASQDKHEGLTAFLEKRAPHWQGK